LIQDATTMREENVIVFGIIGRQRDVKELLRHYMVAGCANKESVQASKLLTILASQCRSKVKSFVELSLFGRWRRGVRCRVYMADVATEGRFVNTTVRPPTPELVEEKN
jgi:hypothetical protein